MTAEQKNQRRPRPNNKKRKRKPSNGPGQPQGNNPHKKKSKSRNSNARRGNNKRRGPKLTDLEKLERTYLNLLEKHLQTRRKYFELFHRANPQQLDKLERQFSHSMAEIRKFESEIRPEYKEKFNQKIDGLKLDLVYSQNHNLNSVEESVSFEGDFEDPHFLRSQEDSFRDDTEESSGSYEDYQKYKGL